MTKDNLSQLFEFLGNLSPGWAVATLVLCIIAYRLPSVMREIFTGFREHVKMKTQLALKQEKANLEITQKRERMQRDSSKAPRQ